MQAGLQQNPEATRYVVWMMTMMASMSAAFSAELQDPREIGASQERSSEPGCCLSYEEREEERDV